MALKNNIFLLTLLALVLQGNASLATELTPEQQTLSTIGYAKVTIASSCFWSLLQGIPIALASTNNNTQKLGVATRCALLGFVIGNVWLSGKRDLEKAYEHAPESTDPQALTAIGTAFGGFLSFATHIAITSRNN